MHTKTHATLMKYSPLTPFILFPFLIAARCLLIDSNLLPGIVVVFFLLVFFMWYLFPYLPVWCDTAGCGGRVHRNSTRISYMTVRLHYSCQICGDFYEVDIFAPEEDARIGG